MTHTANIVEIFSSRQGEGLYVGENMTFVRFSNCQMKCLFCDTVKSINYKGKCKIITNEKALEIPNPVGIASLNNILTNFENKTISVTGGEPLEQSEFLMEWLPTRSSNKILLETNGIHGDRLNSILNHIDIISMDIKLPSSCGTIPRWKEHEHFLQVAIASGKEIYVKIVVTSTTTDVDIQEAINILTQAKKFIPVVIQPASSTLTFCHTVPDERLKSLTRLCNAYLPDVRVIPQMHKVWGVR